MERTQADGAQRRSVAIARVAQHFAGLHAFQQNAQAKSVVFLVQIAASDVDQAAEVQIVVEGVHLAACDAEKRRIRLMAQTAKKQVGFAVDHGKQGNDFAWIGLDPIQKENVHILQYRLLLQLRRIWIRQLFYSLSIVTSMNHVH